ncbi:MAG TPA: DNA polymerase III subunit alpha, partial [Phycisphaerae bacterium]|nr:DNA polymerase III subunit alpha [Phycisphaerae bacterium]
MPIPLHNRSSYSFGSSLTRPEELAAFAAEHGIPAIALTDLNGLYAAVEFQKACQRAGVKPIFGAELTLTSHGVDPRGLPSLPTVNDRENRQHEPAASSRGVYPRGSENQVRSAPADHTIVHRSPFTIHHSTFNIQHVRSAPADHTAERITVTLLAENPTGYGNLCRLISLHHLRETPLDLQDLCEHAEGLICLLGQWNEPRGLSPWYTPILRDAFEGQLYVELAVHGPDDVLVARRRARIADELGIPVLASCESRCLKRWHMPALRALASIGTLTLLDEPHPDKPQGTWHLRTPSEMKHLFHRRPDALANTMKVAERCNMTIDLSQNRFPPFESSDRRSAAQHLRDLCVAGCRRRYVEQPQQKGIGGKRPTLAEALERLDRELTVIEQVHYAEYFLVFHEIVEYCRSWGIAVLARGSAADSLVCYSLGVSHACPFRFDLPFDRFLNPERARFSKMADIDLDLPWDRRDEVVRWVYERWGYDRVAMIGSPNRFHGRAVVAELGKVLGLPPHEVHEITRYVPHTSADDLARAIPASPEARRLSLEEEPLPSILRVAGLFEGLPRHWSMHPCGLVVSPEPLTDLVPVQRSPKGPLVAQYDMDAIEELGFIKIDLLGQAGLSVLRDTVDEVHRTEGITVDLEQDVDYSEGQTWDMIARGDARGVHHIESPAMTSLLVQSNCRDIDCLTAIVAIIRPGAANQGKKEAFCRRYQQLEPPGQVHPALTSVLAGTYGLMIFEEHILQAAVEFAGMNLGRADVLRRALNKENLPMIRRMEGEFREAARLQGRSEAEINEVWAMIEGFRGFMFNKAHSAEYAVEAFQGAWLKRRWPAHYLAAVLSNYRGFYAHSPTLPQILYVMEALRLGVGFLPPCVNRSRKRFSVEHVQVPHRAGGEGPNSNESRPALTSHGVYPRGLPFLPTGYGPEDRPDNPAGSTRGVYPRGLPFLPTGYGPED